MQAQQHQWVGIIANSSICMSSEETWIRIKKFQNLYSYHLWNWMRAEQHQWTRIIWGHRTLKFNGEFKITCQQFSYSLGLCHWMRAQQHQWIRITANSSITNILWEVWIRIKKFRFEFLLFSLPKSYVLRTFAGWERNNPNGYELLQIHPLQIFLLRSLS